MGVKIPIAKVKIGNEEINAVVEVLRSGKLIQGEKVKKFEELFAQKVGAKYAVAVSSGTTALHIAYLALINPGDEILVPSFSHISTASMVCFAGGKPVFCDIDPKTFTIDLEEIKRKITPKTKAIAPVHLFGNACEIDEILKIAKEYNLKVIWDAAQAHGTKYKGKDIGSFDDVVCYSFYPTKNMITGEGGMLTTNDPELDRKFRLIRSQGQEKKYYHTMIGTNYRMTEIEAAIGIEQLKKLDNMLQKRRKNAEFLTKELSSIKVIKTPVVKSYVFHSYHQYSIVLEDKIERDKFAQFLKEKGIGVGIHYPRPLHKQPVFNSSESLPTCEYLSKRILSLPVHPYLTKEELGDIVTIVKEGIELFS